MTPSDTAARPSLTLGPVLFNWSPEAWRDFHYRVADEAPVERVCVGEVVCSKRLPFYQDDIPGVIERLQRGGKAVILSSLALPTLVRERNMIKDLVAMPGVLVEANDVSAFPQLAGRPHAISPLINVYNEGTLAFMEKQGAVHVCLPPELPLTAMAPLAAKATTATIEAWAFGRAPLAISARCYHARVHGVSKDSCQFVCNKDPDGLEVDTLEGRRFLSVNGVQTLSDGVVNLIGDLDAVTACGVSSFRLSPHTCDMVAVAQAFRDVLDGTITGAEGEARIAALMPGVTFANGFLHGKPGHQRIALAG
ncbi:ubiquinone anaerobic biosynthesis protein UbiV [Rhodoplanes roseus]|uniref:Ubiquinone biosynthesis protein UbiV n=1 Tax=Rhodoplanes roseus TaxID=29409 RepID=A0A327KYF6_9BRAD|nr:U32 family peptidase [Rhodoplanes roseus]RAI43087.1 U32 family peptidase [Rhodoplanes roseus]